MYGARVLKLLIPYFVVLVGFTCILCGILLRSMKRVPSEFDKSSKKENPLSEGF